MSALSRLVGNFVIQVFTHESKKAHTGAFSRFCHMHSTHADFHQFGLVVKHAKRLQLQL
jgi:hypothetical protein